MSNSNYKVHKEVLKTINYDILILALPENDLEDYLTQFVPERGQISKSLYEDFIIANCIANLNQFMSFVHNSQDIDIIKLRNEVTDLIIKYNPLLDPESIIINRNKVLKLKKEGQDGIPLPKNEWWNKNINSGINDSNKKNTQSKNKKKGVNIDNLKYEAVKVWWDRINEYVSIKKYSNNDVESILTEKYFHSRNSFNTYIVSTCVVEVEALYERIEGMGVSVAPIKIISELFDLCVGVNEGISYERAQDLQPEGDMTDGSKNNNGTQKAYTADRAGKLNKKNKNKATFKKVTKEELKKLDGNMKLSLIGQDEAVDVVTEAVKRASVGLKDPDKPLGSFLFAGRTGCGKTLASKVLADELIKTRKNRIVIDCSEYSSQHEYSKLIGAPSGYIGHDNGGVLTNAISEDPFSVVVFDEIEKASSNVFDLMLQILDEGRLTDGRGKIVSFREAIIIMTSNIGVDNIDAIEKTIGFGDVAKINEQNKKQAIDSALKKKFKPEFLNRLDSIVFFKDLNKDDYMRIIDIELGKLTENLKNNDTEYKDIKITFDKKIRNFIFGKGVDEKYGARPIKRAIEKEISNMIAGVLLDHDCDENTEISVTLKRNNVCVEILQKEGNVITPKSKYLNGVS